MNCYLGQKSSKDMQVCGIRLNSCSLGTETGWDRDTRQTCTWGGKSGTAGKWDSGLGTSRVEPKLPPAGPVALEKQTRTLCVIIATWGRSPFAVVTSPLITCTPSIWLSDSV